MGGWPARLVLPCLSFVVVLCWCQPPTLPDDYHARYPNAEPFIAQLLAPDPADRFASGESFGVVPRMTCSVLNCLLCVNAINDAAAAKASGHPWVRGV